MFAIRKNSRKGFAATACVIVLALMVGPGCAGLCAVANCTSGATSTGKDGGCHHVEHEHGAQFSRAVNVGVCGAQDMSVAVTSKPRATARAGSETPQESAAATGSTVLGEDAAGSANFYLSDGYSPGIFTTKPTGQILRL
ncbi:MAG TPA: hypothetical protein VKD70_04155 [Candidatus Acidoferrum sp.]|nr:hypothetical protein [Candidatus Acidoferrum sp.]